MSKRIAVSSATGRYGDALVEQDARQPQTFPEHRSAWRWGQYPVPAAERLVKLQRTQQPAVICYTD